MDRSLIVNCPSGAPVTFGCSRSTCRNKSEASPSVKRPLAGKALPARVSRVAIVAMVVLPESLSDPVLVTDQFLVPTPEEYAVDIHKPKPIHNWREFLSEISIVVIGILIALLLEQGVEAWRLREKADAGEASIRAEFSDQLAYATVFLKLKTNLDTQVEKLEAAAVVGDHAEAARLASSVAPFEMRPWSVSAWDAAASEQIVSHIDQARRRNYQILRRQVTTMSEIQYRFKDNYATLLGTRLPVNSDAIVAEQISAAEHLRSDSVLATIIASTMIERGKKLGLLPTPERLKTAIADRTDCNTPGRLAAGSTRVCS